MLGWNDRDRPLGAKAQEKCAGHGERLRPDLSAGGTSSLDVTVPHGDKHISLGPPYLAYPLYSAYPPGPTITISPTSVWGRISVTQESKVVLITGGSRGIGRALAEGLLEKGHRIAITGRGREQVDATARNLGGHVLAVSGDVSSKDDARTAVDRTLEYYGRIDVLVNNAGISGADTPLSGNSRGRPLTRPARSPWRGCLIPWRRRSASRVSMCSA
jgi:hypothetical protein